MYDSDLDFTDRAWNALYQTVDRTDFSEGNARLIYDSLQKYLRSVPFGDYLRRYIYDKAGLTGAYEEIPVRDYVAIMRESFADWHTPPSFEPTTAKFSHLAKNWLTQQTVHRKVVLLLGFGLHMHTQDVNLFLTKGIQEQALCPRDPLEVLCWYCYEHQYNYLKLEKLREAAQQARKRRRVVLPDDEHTAIVWQTVLAQRDSEDKLIDYVSGLFRVERHAQITAREHFHRLYNEAGKIAAQLAGKSDVSDLAEEGAAADIEAVLCAAVPRDRHGNLTPSKRSSLHKLFAGRRLSRQHISAVLHGTVAVSRWDLLTLNFLVFACAPAGWESEQVCFSRYLADSNAMLDQCSMGEIYVQNPYECFLLMCLLSKDPLGAYMDVWEQSYEA